MNKILIVLFALSLFGTIKSLFSALSNDFILPEIRNRYVVKAWIFALINIISLGALAIMSYTS